jgi:dTMP kinase
MIHQAGKIKDKLEREKFLDWLEELEFEVFEIPKPDKVIFLNVNPDMSQKLVLKKDEREYLKN